MRTFNGLQIFTQQLTNSGQLDARYVRINPDYSFYKNTNFNITGTLNIFYSNDNGYYTGYLPDIEDKKMITIKNLYSQNVLTISGYASGQGYDMADEVIDIPSPQAIQLLGIKNSTYTGWVNLTSTAGIGISNIGIP